MDRNLGILAAAGLIAVALVFGIWYQNYNSPFERCVRSETVIEVSRGVERNYAGGLALRRCYGQLHGQSNRLVAR